MSTHKNVVTTEDVINMVKYIQVYDNIKNRIKYLENLSETDTSNAIRVHYPNFGIDGDGGTFLIPLDIVLSIHKEALKEIKSKMDKLPFTLIDL